MFCTRLYISQPWHRGFFHFKLRQINGNDVHRTYVIVCTLNTRHRIKQLNAEPSTSASVPCLNVDYPANFSSLMSFSCSSFYLQTLHNDTSLHAIFTNANLGQPNHVRPNIVPFYFLVPLCPQNVTFFSVVFSKKTFFLSYDFQNLCVCYFLNPGRCWTLFSNTPSQLCPCFSWSSFIEHG